MPHNKVRAGGADSSKSAQTTPGGASAENRCHEMQGVQRTLRFARGGDDCGSCAIPWRSPWDYRHASTLPEPPLQPDQWKFCRVCTPFEMDGNRASVSAGSDGQTGED